MAFTYFFRDATVLQSALDHALPRMLGRSFIHVWDAGCAHGPEPYTLAMMLRERMSNFAFRNVKIHATDLDSTGRFATQIGSGLYTEEELRRTPAVFREKYLQKGQTEGYWQIIDELRAKVRFSQHDLLSLKPIRQAVTMVVCKNVLLHFAERERANVLRMFHGCLCDDGLLVMEHTQAIPASVQGLFAPIREGIRIYQKVKAEWGDSAARPPRLPAPHWKRAASVDSESAHHGTAGKMAVVPRECEASDTH